MAAGTSVVTMTADAIQTAVSALGGVTSSWQGKHRVTTGDVEDGIRAATAETSGVFMFSVADRAFGTQTQVGEVTFRGLLMARLPNDDSSDCNSAYDLAESVARAISTELYFVGSGSRPTRVTWGPAAPDRDRLEDEVVVFEFSMRFQTGPACNP